MNEREHMRRDIQFIVNEGIIYSKRDIMSILWDLGHIIYYEVSGDKVLNKGKGLIMRVSANAEDPTLFLNGRIYINVLSVDYLKVKKVKDSITLYELHGGDRLIKIIPDPKKQMLQPYRLFADNVMGLGMGGEGEMMAEGEDSDDIQDEMQL